MARRAVFALDQDFPALGAASPQGWFPEVELRPLRSVDPALTAGHEDWEVLRGLKRLGGIDGFITLDDGMTNLPKEMTILDQSRLTLLVLQNVDNDPLVAWGLLMVHLPEIVRRLDRTKSQLWLVRRKPLDSPMTGRARVVKIAEFRNEDPDRLFKASRIPLREFAP